jgi:hypothetical protein
MGTVDVAGHRFEVPPKSISMESPGDAHGGLDRDVVVGDTVSFDLRSRGGGAVGTAARVSRVRRSV